MPRSGEGPSASSRQGHEGKFSEGERLSYARSIDVDGDDIHVVELLMAHR